MGWLGANGLPVGGAPGQQIANISWEPCWPVGVAQLPIKLVPDRGQLLADEPRHPMAQLTVKVGPGTGSDTVKLGAKECMTSYTVTAQKVGGEAWL